MKKDEKKRSEAFKRKALARWRLLSSRGVALDRAAVEIGVAGADLEMWSRAAAPEGPLFIPVHVEGEDARRSGLVIVLGCGVRVEGLSLADVAELARRLS
ncbi:MAG TPA: hypothetical protein VE033_01540 [Acetobacteraceae bacterium]|nr:hypothetical protein [Acetobacteraceae bacterium]